MWEWSRIEDVCFCRLNRAGGKRSVSIFSDLCSSAAYITPCLEPPHLRTLTSAFITSTPWLQSPKKHPLSNPAKCLYLLSPTPLHTTTQHLTSSTKSYKFPLSYTFALVPPTLFGRSDANAKSYLFLTVKRFVIDMLVVVGHLYGFYW